MPVDTHVKSTSALRTFGHNLIIASRTLDQKYTNMVKDLNKVCEGWIDKNQDTYRQEFSEKQVLVRQMAISMQQYAIFMKNAADIIDEYERLKNKIGH